MDNKWRIRAPKVPDGVSKHRWFNEKPTGCGGAIESFDMSPDVAPHDTEPKPMNEFSRILGIFFEPKKTFEDIAERPQRWIVPMLLVIVAGMAYIYTFGAHVGWGAYLHRLLDNNRQIQQLPPEQRLRVFDMYQRFASVGGMIQIAIGVPLVYLIGSGIAFGIIKGLLGTPMRFKATFAVYCYAALPSVLLRVLSIVVVFLKNPEDVDPLNPFMSNLGALMDPDHSSKFLYALATSFDVFSLWVLLLTATGLKAVGGKRLSYGGALFAVALPWAVFVLIGAALATLRG
jgi:hypothetical protein